MAHTVRCSRCGADNSVRRATCYACQAPLTPGAPAPAQHPDSPLGANDSAASRRFAAVIHERQTARDDHPPAAPPPVASAPPLPTFYPYLGQVRRDMLFFRQLQTAAQAGIPLAQTLVDLQRRGDPALRAAVAAMGRHVIAGGRLSDAMRPYNKLFLAYHAALVQAGEVSGSLPQALEQIASDCELEYKLRRGIAVAQVSVSIVIGALLLITPVALLLREPPPGEYWTMPSVATRYVIKLLTVSLPAALGLGGLYILWATASRSRWLAPIQHRVLLALPLIGRAHRRAATTRFLGSLSLLLNAGIPVGEAYRVAANATGNQALARHLLREADDLYAGRGLADMLRRLGVTAGTAVDQAAIGETAGKLPAVLGHMAADYRRRAEISSRHLPLLLQFVAYLVIGPFAVLLWYGLCNAYFHFRFYAPLDQLFNVP